MMACICLSMITSMFRLLVLLPAAGYRVASLRSVAGRDCPRIGWRMRMLMNSRMSMMLTVRGSEGVMLDVTRMIQVVW